MKTENFINLTRAITGRDFFLSDGPVNSWERVECKPTLDPEILPGKSYEVYRILPLSKRVVSFKWVSALDEEKTLRSFVTAFTSKYFEPNPACFGYRLYGPESYWENFTEERRENCFFVHRGHMLSKAELMAQVEANFCKDTMQGVIMRDGFYVTNYGIGVCVIYCSASVKRAIETMKTFLAGRGVSFTNEFSTAGWVFRFKIGLSRETHAALLASFS